MALRKSKTPSSRKVAIILTAVLALLSVLIIVIVTRWGIGTSPDSADYISKARKLEDNFGAIETMGTFRGVFYPAVLAIFGYIDTDAMVGARWLSALLFGANIILLATMVGHLNHEVWWLAPVTALFALVSGVMINVHSYAWSEPLFIFLVLISLGLLNLFLERKQWVFVILAALVTGLAILTRYAGLALAATGVLGILVFASGLVHRRMLLAGIYGLLSVLPLTVWLFVTGPLGDTAPRAIVFHPIERSQLWQAIFTVTDWLNVPSTLPGIMRLGLLMLIGAGVAAVILWTRRGHQTEMTGLGTSEVPYLVKLFTLFLLVYGLFLVVSISFFDANMIFDDRILSPAYPIFLALVIYAASEIFMRTRREIGAVALAVLGLLFLTPTLISSIDWSHRSYQQGIGFTSLAWQRSQLIQEVREIPIDIHIASNRPEPIYLLADRPAEQLPKEFEKVTQQANLDYEEEMVALQEKLESGSGVIVYFYVADQESEAREASLVNHLSLRIRTQAMDGIIYHTGN